MERGNLGWRALPIYWMVITIDGFRMEREGGRGGGGRGDEDCWCKHYYGAYQMKDVMFVYWLPVTTRPGQCITDNQQLLTAR